MAAKLILVLCAQALLVQTAFSQCWGRAPIAGPACGSASAGLAAPGLIASGWGASGCAGNSWAGNGLIGLDIIPTSGGALPVSSVSSIAPSGLSINSENVFDGALSVAGELPFVSAVALEGVLASGGAGAVSYSCGNGVTAIESIAPAGAYGGAGAYGSASASVLAAGYGLGAGAIPAAGRQLAFGTRTCGCGQ
ncbi:chorion class B protein Ld34-like [Helicoverpa zea]|uniref:chorion class B protein Ld34-like n=1 Tax=Helicoverpa zea TaxID=7113 RepID=UPI001F5A83C9|nr:chorion class B protein Ld34-like [Helicoverpa zea]